MASSKSKLIFAPGESPSDAHESNTAQQASQFKVGTLTRKDLNPDPFVLFHEWFSNPKLNGQTPETVTLSTAELPSGKVSSRMVYLKELDDKGFVIYSNWGTSQKAHDIATNPYASLCFWWKPLERQVRVSGPAHRLTPAESQVYYDTRARGSRIGAWASQQSRILTPETNPRIGGARADTNADDDNDNDDDGRAELEAQVRHVQRKFEGQEKIPVPEFWGGLRVVPERMEFWQGRDSRLHDRFEYVRDGVDSDHWEINRLSP